MRRGDPANSSPSEVPTVNSTFRHHQLTPGSDNPQLPRDHGGRGPVESVNWEAKPHYRKRPLNFQAVYSEGRARPVLLHTTRTLNVKIRPRLLPSGREHSFSPRIDIVVLVKGRQRRRTEVLIFARHGAQSGPGLFAAKAVHGLFE